MAKFINYKLKNKLRKLLEIRNDNLIIRQLNNDYSGKTRLKRIKSINQKSTNN
jgi:hypothetical protein